MRWATTPGSLSAAAPRDQSVRRLSRSVRSPATEARNVGPERDDERARQGGIPWPGTSPRDLAGSGGRDTATTRATRTPAISTARSRPSSGSMNRRLGCSPAPMSRRDTPAHGHGVVRYLVGGLPRQPRLHRPPGRDAHQADQGWLRADAARLGAPIARADVVCPACGRRVGGLLRLRAPRTTGADLRRRRPRRPRRAFALLTEDLATGGQATPVRLHDRADVGAPRCAPWETASGSPAGSVRRPS